MAPQTFDHSEGEKVCGADESDKPNKDKGIVGLLEKRFHASRSLLKLR